MLPSPLPLTLSFLNTNTNDRRNSLPLHSSLCFSRYFCLHYSSCPSQSLLQQMWHYYPPFYRCDKSTDLCSDSPRLTQQGQDGAHSSIQVSDLGPVLWAMSLKVPGIFRETRAPVLGTALQFLFSYIHHPCAHS